VPELVRGVVLLNSAGQFADPDKPAAAPAAEEGEEGSPLSRFVVKPLKEAFQRVVLGFLFWQSKQPARVEKVLRSVSNQNTIEPALLFSFISCHVSRGPLTELFRCRCTSTRATWTSTW